MQVWRLLAHVYKTITQHSEYCVMGVANTAEKNVFTPAKIVRYTQKSIFFE